MNALLQQVADIVKHYPWQTKILLVPSLRDGHQFLEGLAGKGSAWMNLRPVTPLGLAAELSEDELRRQGVTPASSEQLAAVLEEILSSLYGAGEIKYFAALQNKGILSRVLLHSLADLRLAGVAHDMMDTRVFVDHVKGEEIQRILESYVSTLYVRKLADEAMIYETALQRLKQDPGCIEGSILLIPKQLDLPALPQRMAEILQTLGARLLAEEPVMGARWQGPRLHCDVDPTPVSPFSYIFEPQSAPVPPEIKIFRAYGKSNEVSEVLRRIKTSGIPLDQVLITYTRGRQYTTQLYSHAEQIGLPITFGSGIPIAFTRPGRFIAALLDWFGQGCPASLFYKLLTSGDIAIKKPMEAGRQVRKADLGWGWERYIPALRHMLDSNTRAMELAQQQEKEEKGQQLGWEREMLEEILSLLENIQKHLPAPDDKNQVPYPAFCLGMAAMVADYGRVAGEIDGQAREAILQILQEQAAYQLISLDYQTALQRILTLCSESSVGASSPQPGIVHAASIEDAEWNPRPAVYVLGMDATLLDQATLQDPVLLDSEREKLSPGLTLMRQEPGQRNYQIARMLASRRGPVTLSFACFDVSENRACLPSALLLQAYRLLSGDPQADYSTFLTWLAPAATYYPEAASQAVNETEWWLGQGRWDSQAYLDPARVLALYPQLSSGAAALAARQGYELTEYDGILDLEDDRLDPRENPSRRMSASAIETMAKCPFQYFMKYILRVELPEDTETEAAQWLDPLTRGSLLHSIYCSYQRQVFNQKVPAILNRQLLTDLAETAIQQLAQEIPPPSPVVYQLEKEHLMRGLDIYHKMLEQGSQFPGQPSFFEIPFGAAAEEIAVAGMGTTDAISITLPSGKGFHLRGIIDRIDCDGNQQYQVWDYKTGSTYNYSERGYVKQGQQVQHVLYSAAAEAILSSQGIAARVTAAGYIFPTEKGEGLILTRSQEARQKGLAAVETILDLMAQGFFHATHDTSSCSYCDYRPVCRETTASERVKSLYAVEGQDELDIWKELQRYE